MVQCWIGAQLRRPAKEVIVLEKSFEGLMGKTHKPFFFAVALRLICPQNRLKIPPFGRKKLQLLIIFNVPFGPINRL